MNHAEKCRWCQETTGNSRDWVDSNLKFVENRFGLFKAILRVTDLSLTVRSGFPILIHVHEYQFVD